MHSNIMTTDHEEGCMTKTELIARIFSELRAFLGAGIAGPQARKIVGIMEEWMEEKANG